MDNNLFEVESYKVFSESLIWQLNRDYYNQSGIEAWSKGVVPHQITSNSLVGRTYAEQILGFLKDLAAQGATEEIVYIVELGAGHGRLGYHILKHLEKLTALQNIKLPPYCYVLTDIVEENLIFFEDHPQLQSFYKSGLLDYAYYDAIGGESIELRYANRTIKKGELNQALIGIGNYFFDSIPNDLFHFQNNETSLCSIALHSTQDLGSEDAARQLKSVKLSFREQANPGPHYESDFMNDMLDDYRANLSDSYIFFPEKSMLCLENLKALSTKGLMVLSMDKGFHELEKLDKKPKPEIITHGSFSLWVNFHALGNYCERLGGKALFPSYSTFHTEVACLLFVDDSFDYSNSNAAYQQSVNDFGPDDFNSIKKLSYSNISKLSLMHLIALLRLSAYDSTFFTQILPRIKQLVERLSNAERERMAQSLDLVWLHYFDISEKPDLALKIAGIFFDLAFYERALIYYDHSTDSCGVEVDTFYNKAICYYQLRQDKLFVKALEEAKLLFPDSDLFDKLKKLDLNAV